MGSNTFCPLLWFQLSSTTDGYYRPCCEFKWKQKDKISHWSDDISNYYDKIQNIKTQLLNSEQPTECNQCWDLESKGIESLRTKSLSNPLFNKNLDYGIVSTDMKLGNLCNLGCRMCEPHSSTVLQNEVKNNSTIEWTDSDIDAANQDYLKNNWTELALQKISNIETLRHLKFTGGEPFAISSISDFLESIKESKNITLEFSTNALLINDKKINLLKKFKQVKMHISCDGIQNSYNYIRWPGNWNKFEKKLNNIQYNTNFDVRISVTANAYNVFILPEILEYFKNRNLDASIIVVNDPRFLHPWIFPKHLKRKIISKYRLFRHIQELDIVLRHNTDFDQDLYNEFIKQKKIKDLLRNQDFDIFGELYNV
jgi:MoaA/NifB/PqqE/SkfB family radical SAM enzyme